MRFLTLKDTHFRFGFTPPVSRNETFERDIYDKIDFVMDLAKRNNIDTLILTGDTTDVKAPSNYTLEQVRANLNVFKYLRTQFKHIYDIAGNHSLPFSSLDFKPQSFYYLLVEHGLVHDITTQPLTIDGAYIYGIDYTPSQQELLDRMHSTDDYCKQNRLHAVAIIHEHIVPDGETLSFVKFLNYSTLATLKNHRIIIAGHLHKGYPLKTINNTLFVNIWNFTRLARDYYAVNDAHKPQVALIDTRDITTASVIDIPHKPFKIAFKEGILKDETELNENLAQFIQNVTTLKQVDDLSIDDMPVELQERIKFYLDKVSLT